MRTTISTVALLIAAYSISSIKLMIMVIHLHQSVHVEYKFNEQTEFMFSSFRVFTDTIIDEAVDFIE